MTNTYVCSKFRLRLCHVRFQDEVSRDTQHCRRRRNDRWSHCPRNCRRVILVDLGVSRAIIPFGLSIVLLTPYPNSLAAGSSFIGLAQGFKILANGKVCTVVWTMVAAICTALAASIQTLGKLAILTWIGFASIFTAVFIVV